MKQKMAICWCQNDFFLNSSPTTGDGCSQMLKKQVLLPFVLPVFMTGFVMVWQVVWSLKATWPWAWNVFSSIHPIVSAVCINTFSTGMIPKMLLQSATTKYWSYMPTVSERLSMHVLWPPAKSTNGETNAASSGVAANDSAVQTCHCCHEIHANSLLSRLGGPFGVREKQPASDLSPHVGTWDIHAGEWLENE